MSHLVLIEEMVATTDKEWAERQLGLFRQKMNITDMMSEINLVKKKKKRTRSTIKQMEVNLRKNDSIKNEL